MELKKIFLGKLFIYHRILPLNKHIIKLVKLLFFLTFLSLFRLFVSIDQRALQVAVASQ